MLRNRRKTARKKNTCNVRNQNPVRYASGNNDFIVTSDSSWDSECSIMETTDYSETSCSISFSDSDRRDVPRVRQRLPSRSTMRKRRSSNNRHHRGGNNIDVAGPSHANSNSRALRNMGDRSMANKRKRKEIPTILDSEIDSSDHSFSRPATRITVKRLRHSELDSDDSDSSVIRSLTVRRNGVINSDSSNSSEDIRPVNGSRITLAWPDESESSSLFSDSENMMATTVRTVASSGSSNSSTSSFSSSSFLASSASNSSTGSGAFSNSVLTSFIDSDSLLTSADSSTRCSTKSYASAREQILSSDSDSGDSDGEKCAICLKKFRTQQIGNPSNCDHQFCFKCLEEWSKSSNTCPVDRSTFEAILVRHEIGGSVVDHIEVQSRNLAAFAADVEEILINETISCELCGSGDDEETLLLCDLCNLGYHMACLNPPLHAIPAHSWYCPPCRNLHQNSENNLTNEAMRRLVSNLPISPLAFPLSAIRPGGSRTRNTRQNAAGPPLRGRGFTVPSRIRNHSAGSNTVNSLEQRIEEFYTELNRCMKTAIRKKRRSRRARNRSTNVALEMTRNVAEISSLQDRVAAKLDESVLTSTGPVSRPSEIVDLVFPNFSLFRNDDLAYFSDEANDESYDGEMAIMARVRREYSARRLENRKNLVSNLVNSHNRISTIHSFDLPTTENISSSSNLLDSILESQTLWHSKNVEISSMKDGTLEVKLKKDDGKPDLSNSNHSSKEIPLFPNKSASSSETSKSYANNTRYSSFSGNSNSNSSSFSQSTSSFNSLNPPPRPGFSSILGTNSTALDLSPFTGAAPIRFRMNPPRPTLRRNYNSNLTRLVAGTNLVQSPRKQSSQSGGTGDDEVDLYDDIDTETAEPEKATEIFSSLEPPPEPPALLIGSDTSSDEDNGLVIDDKASNASRSNIYDPNEPTNEDSDADSKNVNCRPYMRSPSYGGISEFGPHLPLPEPPALPVELESVNNSESEEEADCPNMNLYSHTSISLANNVQDIPIPESDYPSVSDEVLECIPVPRLTPVPEEGTPLPVKEYNSPPMIPIFSAAELYSPSKKVESDSDISVQEMSNDVPELKKLVSRERSSIRHTSSERDSSPDVEERKPRRRRKRSFADDDRNMSYRSRRNYSSAEERIRSYVHSSSDEDRVRASQRSSREHLRVRERSQSRRRSSRTMNNMGTRSRKRSSMESSGNENVSLKDSIHTIISDESSTVSDTLVDEKVKSDLSNVCDINSVDDPVDRIDEIVNVREVDAEPTKGSDDDETPTVETGVVAEKDEGGDEAKDEETGIVDVEEIAEQYQVIVEDGAEQDLAQVTIVESNKLPPQKVEQVADEMPNNEDILKIDKNDSSEVVTTSAYLLPSDDLDPVSDVEYNDFTDVQKFPTKEGRKKRKKIRKRTSPILNQSAKGERELEEGEIEDEKSRKRRILSRKRKGSGSPTRISGKKQKSKKDRKDKGPVKENKDTSKNESDPLWKKLSKSTKDRNYRDGKARPEKLSERNKERVSNATKKEKRKEIERYDVRKVVSEKPRTVRDEFGRDISLPRTRSRSVSIARSYSSIRRSKGSHRKSVSPDDRWIDWSPVWTQRRSRSRNRKSRSRERNRSRLSGDRYRNRSKGERRESRKRRRSMSSVARYSPVENKRKRSKEKSRRSDSYNVRLSREVSDYYYERSWTRSPSLYASLTPDPEPYINRYERSPSNLEPNRIPMVSPEPRLLSQNTKNLTVIVPNVETTKKKHKKKKDGKKKKKKQPSKEVFTSGDNIVVSVNFDDNQKTISAKSSKRKHDDDKTKKKKKNARKKRKKTLHVSEEVLNAKPVAVIDLNTSPCKEMSPMEVISLTDSGDESKVNDKISSADRHLSDDTNTYIMINAGPKTPPEPSIKFTVSSSVPLRACVTNPIFEQDEELDREVDAVHYNQGPNTPPEPSVETLSATMYDPFEPTKSRSPSPVNVDATTPEGHQCIDIFADNSEKISESQTNDKSQEENKENSVVSVTTADETQTTKHSPAKVVVSSEALNETTQNTSGNTLVLDLSSLGDDFVPKSTIPLVKTSQGKYEFQSSKTADRPITVVISQQSASKPQPQQVMVTPTRQVPAKPVEPIKQPMFPDILPWKLPPLSQAPFTTPPAAVSTVTSTTLMTQSKSVSSINQNGSQDDFLLELDDSPYSPASSEDDDLFEPPPLNSSSSGLPLPSVNLYKSRVDSLFNSSPVKKPLPRSSSYPKPGMKKKLPKPISSGKKDVGIRADEEQLKILDDVPNSAVEMIVKEKFLKKLHRQERVVEEVKVVLKPHYAKKHITKEEYKDILRRAVPKICHNKTGDINPSKIQGLVEAYVRKIRYSKKKVSNLNTLPGSTNAPVFPNMTNAAKPKKQKNIWS